MFSSLLFGECKWTSTKMTAADLESLKARAAKLMKLDGFTASYVLVSKSGSTADLKRRLPGDTRLLEGAAFREVVG